VTFTCEHGTCERHGDRGTVALKTIAPTPPYELTPVGPDGWESKTTNGDRLYFRIVKDGGRWWFDLDSAVGDAQAHMVAGCWLKCHAGHPGGAQMPHPR
jgi:hypothetical protein